MEGRDGRIVDANERLAEMWRLPESMLDPQTRNVRSLGAHAMAQLSDPEGFVARIHEILSLPEGESEAKAALARFAHMDGANRLLGRGILRFDMRDPTKMVMRMPEGRTVPSVAVPSDAANASGSAQGEAAEAKKPEAALPQALASREQG